GKAPKNRTAKKAAQRSAGYHSANSVVKDRVGRIRPSRERFPRRGSFDVGAASIAEASRVAARIVKAPRPDASPASAIGGQRINPPATALPLRRLVRRHPIGHIRQSR